MKRLLATVVAFVMLVAALPMHAGAASEFEIKNGVLTRYKGTNGIVSVPNTVTAIGDYAFSKSSFVAKVILPDSVKTIGNYAFSECSGLSSISFGNAVTSIGAGAFENCYFLKDFDIPDSVESIGSNAFANCYSISSLKLGNALTYLGPRAFSMCIGLKTVSIPANLAEIGGGAFAGCMNLENYAVSEENTAFSAFGGVLYSKDGKTLVDYPKARKGAYTLQEGTRIITSAAFSYASGLTGLAGTQSLEIIGPTAFEYCDSLRDIYLPNATAVHNYAFYNCSSLKTARIGGASIGQYAFARCAVLNTVIIAEGSTSIGEFAFGWCPELKDLVLPLSIQYIGKNVFSYSPKDTAKDTRILCEYGSVPHKFFSSFKPPMNCMPLPKPSVWAVDIIEAADRFAVANLQIGYKENATRKQFALAVANFLEQYYNMGIDALVAERGLTLGEFSDTEDKDILAVNALGIINGTGEGKFSPDSLLTREQAATLMYRVMDMLGVDMGDVPEAQYKDAAKISAWAKTAVSVMTDLGIMVGDGTNFNPGQQCTREMCIIMFSRLWEAVK